MGERYAFACEERVAGYGDGLVGIAGTMLMVAPVTLANPRELAGTLLPLPASLLYGFHPIVLLSVFSSPPLT